MMRLSTLTAACLQGDKPKRAKSIAVAALCTLGVAGCQTASEQAAPGASIRTVDLRPGTYTAPFGKTHCGKLYVGPGGVIKSYDWGKCRDGLGRMFGEIDSTKADKIRITPANNIIIGRIAISQVTTSGDCLRGKFYIKDLIDEIKYFCRR